jgi:3-phosphoinositide dependent protein kinase-1
MITSSARIIIAASGGDEKKAKMEISLLGPGTTWKSFKDNKQLTSWCVDTVRLVFQIWRHILTQAQREKHILFEPPTSPLPEPDGTAIVAQEWLDSLAKAKELAITQQSLTGSYSGDSTLELSSSQIPSPAGSTLGGGPTGLGAVAASSSADHLHLHHLHHQHPATAFYTAGAAADAVSLDGVNVPTGSRGTAAAGGLRANDDADSLRKGRKRFSRRQSKGGLAAVF